MLLRLLEDVVRIELTRLDWHWEEGNRLRSGSGSYIEAVCVGLRQNTASEAFASGSGMGRHEVGAALHGPQNGETGGLEPPVSSRTILLPGSSCPATS